MSVVDVSSKGANYLFSLSLLKENKVTGEVNSMPLSPGVLSSIIIEDNILDIGLSGRISIDNKYKLLDKINDSLTDNTYIDVNIVDSDSKSTRLGSSMISFLSLVEKTSSLSENIENSRTIFNIEEAVTSLLKKSSLFTLELKTSDNNDTITSHIKKIISKWQEKNLKSGNILGEFEDSLETGDLISFNSDTDNDSLYDIISNMVDGMQISGSMPFLKITSTENAGRLLTLKEMFTDKHRDFINTYTSGRAGSNVDYSDVYLEGFGIAPLTPKLGIPTTNIIEDYQLLDADIESARSKFWGDYQLDNTGDDITTTNIELLDFTSIVDSFESDDLNLNNGTRYSNIPLLLPQEKKLFKAARNNNNGADGIQTLKNSISNKVKKSFLCLGETIILTVPGKMYRTTGKFITIDGDGGRFDKQLWFVTSIKHVFKGLNYTNEITAVRLTGNSSKYTTLYSKSASVLNSAPAIEFTGTVNTGSTEVIANAIEKIKKLPTSIADFFTSGNK